MHRVHILKHFTIWAAPQRESPETTATLELRKWP